MNNSANKIRGSIFDETRTAIKRLSGGHRYIDPELLTWSLAPGYGRLHTKESCVTSKPLLTRNHDLRPRSSLQG